MHMHAVSMQLGCGLSLIAALFSTESHTGFCHKPAGGVVARLTALLQAADGGSPGNQRSRVRHRRQSLAIIVRRLQRDLNSKALQRSGHKATFKDLQDIFDKRPMALNGSSKHDEACFSGTTRNNTLTQIDRTSRRARLRPSSAEVTEACTPLPAQALTKRSFGKLLCARLRGEFVLHRCWGL